MNAQLPFPLPPIQAPDDTPWRCSTCNKHDSSGTCAPGAWVRRDLHYAYLPGPWLCRPCSVVAWAAYLAVVEERMQLVRMYRVVGYAPTRAQLAAWLETQRERDTHQLPLEAA